MTVERIKEIASDYGLSWFMVYVLFAGVVLWVAIIAVIQYDIAPINATAVQAEALARYGNQTQEVQNFYNQRIFTEGAGRAVATGFVFLVLPLGISYIFTFYHPERRIVPPLLMQLVAAPLLIIYGILNLPQTTTPWFIMALFFMIMVGAMQDRGMVWLLGRSINQKHLQTRVIKVEGLTLEEVRNILLERGTKETLSLRRITDITENGGILLRTVSIADYLTYIEIRNNDQDSSIWLGVVFCETGRYFTKESRGLEEYVEDKTGYLINRMMRARPSESFASIVDAEYPQTLVERLTTDLTGVAANTESMTQMDKIRMLLYGLAFVPIGAYYWQFGWNEGIYGLVATSIGIFAALLSIDVSLRISKQRRDRAER